MKRILLFLLICALTCTFFACGTDTPPEAIVLFPTAARSLRAEAGATFVCSDDSIATVDDSGLLIAHKPGEATVTVTDGAGERIYTLTVLNPDDYISLYDCAKITLKESDIRAKVTEARDTLLKAAATWESVDTLAQTGDRVTVDYIGTVNGKQNDAVSAKNQVLILGDNSFIASVEKAIVGWKAGDSFLFETTIPKDYAAAPSLQGKKVVFDISIDKVEHPSYPDFDNAFVQKYTVYQNVNEFDEKEYANAKATLAIAKMIEKSSLVKDPPKELYDYYFAQYVKRLETVLYYEYQQQVSGLEEILALLELTEEELRASAESQLAGSVMQDCVSHGFLYKHGFVMTEEEFAKGAAVYVAENGYESLDDLLSTSGLSLADIREVVLIDFLAPKAAEMVKVEK